MPRLAHDPEGLNAAVWPMRPDLFITPVEHFFTRSHASIPNIDPATWRIEVGGLVRVQRSFSLKDLLTLPRRQMDATIVCAGLRREELLAVRPMPGELPWGPEPVGNGRWTGVALSDVLGSLGVADEARHVEFIGLDQVDRDGQQFGFGGSVDLAKAVSEVLLATELNGSPLSPGHGFPLRAVVPGWIGARSIKWLGRIMLLKEPSANYFQKKAYRFQRAMNPQDPRDVSAGAALSEVPVNAVILSPAAGEALPAGRVAVQGWAMGSGGRRVSGIEVSSDAGQNWVPARITVEGTSWTWTFWQATVELPRGRHILAVKATDIAGATQPPTVDDTWNVKGYVNNAWHRVAVRIV